MGVNVESIVPYRVETEGGNLLHGQGSALQAAELRFGVRAVRDRSAQVRRRIAGALVDLGGHTHGTEDGGADLGAAKILVDRFRQRDDGRLRDVVRCEVLVRNEPAKLAVKTMWPSSPWACIRGRRTSTP
jgi:hypothetical protein